MVDEEKAGKSIFKKGEEFLSLYRRVEGFTQELLQENERLRYRVVALEQELKQNRERKHHDLEGAFVEKIKILEKENEELLERYKVVERENVNFAARYVEIEEENNNLANLYVASYQLHSTLEFGEVLQIVKEIIINLVGADKFAVFLIDSKKGGLEAVIHEGIEESRLRVVKFGEGTLASNPSSDGGVYVSPEGTREHTELANPLVVIPLKIKNEQIGTIAIYRLLEQKKEFTTLDIELFNLLGGHAATAIFGSKLYSESKRKLTTIQGFLELLKPGEGSSA